MKVKRPEVGLIRPTVALREAFLQALTESDRHDGAGIETLQGPEDFEAWIELLNAEEHTPQQPGHVTCSYWWITDGADYLGAIALRHELNEYLYNFGGHVGYSVRPAYRRRGIASEALRQVVTRAHERGMERLLLTCDSDNIGSQRTIVANGGVLEDTRQRADGAVTLRYWITTDTGLALSKTH